MISEASALPTLLPVPKNLIAFSSKAGIDLFEQSQHKAAYWKLMPYFTTEKGITFCGIATSTILLNAINIVPPLTPGHAPYKIFDQNNIFTAKMIKVVTPEDTYKEGATLPTIARALSTFNVNIKMYHGRGHGMNVNKFRKLAIGAVSSSSKFILVNICRKYINEKGCGHFSPLAAYNAKTDRFLFLDVARYKYPPVWVKTSQLFKSLSKGNDSSSHKSRGFIIMTPKKG